MTAREWLLLLALSLLWGMSFVFVEIALESARPVTLAALRVGGASLFLALVFKIRGGRLGPVLSRWKLYCVTAGLGSALPWALFPWGQQFITSGLAGVLNSTTPLFTVIFAALAGEEKMRGSRLFGVLLGAAGVAVLLGPAVGEGWLQVLGILACVAAAAFYGVMYAFFRRRLSAFPALENATGQLIFATVLLVPASLALEAPLEMTMTARAAASLAGLALLSTAAAYLVFFRLLASAGATNTSLVTFLIPLNATVLGAAVLDERFGASFFIGAALILSSLIFADDKLRGKIAAAMRGR